MIRIIIGVTLLLAFACSNTNELQCKRIGREAAELEKAEEAMRAKKDELIAKVDLIKFKTEQEALVIEAKASVVRVQSLLKRCKKLQAEAIKYNCP